MNVLDMIATANQLTTSYGTVRLAAAQHDTLWHLTGRLTIRHRAYCGEHAVLLTRPVPLAHILAVPQAPYCEDCVTAARRRAVTVAR